jgi:long-chain fatty acid transport protein
MRKTKIALAIAASAMISTPVLATNGDNLIGLGAQSRALGGTGTAAFFGSENALTNPALLGKSQGTEFAIGGTLFKPSVKANSNVQTAVYAALGMGTDAPVSQTSEADTNIIPEVSLSTRINDNWTFGLGIFGSAGMGVDYRDTDELFNGYSNLQLMKFAPSLAYNDGNFGIGFAPVIQYGALDINYIADTDGNMTTESVGNGMSSDLGYGFNLGAYFDVTKDFTIGASYQSAISMEYDDQITVAADGFRIGPNGMGTITSDKLEQPAEIKIGAAYNMGNWMITADAKQIKWGDAKGYKDFNWEDQNVFGIGAKYSGNGYWVGAGYNFGSDPIDKLGTSTDQNAAYSNAAIDVFNNHFFPGIVESHFTFGGGYNITKNMAIDAAVVYAAEVEKTVNSSAISSAYASEYAGTPMMAESEHEVTHSQIGYTVSLRMNF